MHLPAAHGLARIREGITSPVQSGPGELLSPGRHVWWAVQRVGIRFQAMAWLVFRWLTMGLIAVAVSLVLMPGSRPVVGKDHYDGDYDGPHWLPFGYMMPKGYKLESCCYALHLQQDCNLVLYPKGPYGPEKDKPMWASDTAGKATDCNLFMQHDCNAVLYETGTQNHLWASQSAGRGNDCVLWMQDDGNVVIYDSYYYGDDAIWSTETNQTTVIP